MSVVAELPWQWVSSSSPTSLSNAVDADADVRKSKPKSVAVVVKRKEGERQTFHPYLSIWMKGEHMVCKADEANLYWSIVLMKHGGFLRKDLSVIQREYNSEIAKQSIELQETMKLIPIGQKEMQTKYAECQKLLMSDNRIPIWNPVFNRIMVATSPYNVLRIKTNGSQIIIAPWKQRRNCVVIKELSGDKEWEIRIKNDDEVKTEYPLTTFIPRTKTAQNKMTKDELYLICSMFEIHTPKLTKKMMLEFIGEKLKQLS